MKMPKEVAEEAFRRAVIGYYTMLRQRYKALLSTDEVIFNALSDIKVDSKHTYGSVLTNQKEP